MVNIESAYELDERETVDRHGEDNIGDNNRMDILEAKRKICGIIEPGGIYGYRSPF